MFAPPVEETLAMLTFLSATEKEAASKNVCPTGCLSYRSQLHAMLWFDLDNSPHVPLFRPILAALDRRGKTSLVTARDHAQTLELLRLWNIPHTAVGTHAGKSKAKKLLNLFQRANQLRGFMRGKDADLAVSHGSRTQLLAARRLGVPSVLMLDYEYTESRIFNYLARWLLIPSLIPDARLRAAGFTLEKVIRYNGFKEEVYLNDFVPVPDFRTHLGVEEGATLVTIRPPSVTGNYHDALSEELFVECVARCSSVADAHVLIVNRTSAERSLLGNALRSRSNVSILQAAVDGLQLLWASDLVISGGGTMNREAALLGVPTYSIFTGRKPFLDEYLQSQGRLTFVNSEDDVNRIAITKRTIPPSFKAGNAGLADRIAELILDLSRK